MKMPKETVDRRMAFFREACERIGIKVTHQRLEIFRAVASTEEHPDAVSVHRQVRRRVPTVSLDTVYRNLRLFADHGLVSIVGMSHESVRFDANMGLHHHFVCERCGLIRDFAAEAPLAVPEAAKAFGAPRSLRLEVRGVCAACQKKIPRK